MEAMKDLRAFILIMVILAFVWLFTGGPLRPSSKSGWFLNNPQQKENQSSSASSPFLISEATTAVRGHPLLLVQAQVTTTTKRPIRLQFFSPPPSNLRLPNQKFNHLPAKVQ